VRAFSHREKVAEGRMRDLQNRKIPHPVFDHPLPVGEGPREHVNRNSERPFREVLREFTNSSRTYFANFHTTPTNPAT
jgi:hypothetical protein